MSDLSLRARIEQYYATVPLLFADAETFGPLRLFVRKEPGTPYYGGPSHAQPTAEGSAVVTAADIARVRARQRELGVPEAFEWLAEAAPMLRARIEAVGLPVEARPLMALDPHRPVLPQPLPDGVTIRALSAEDPALPAALALPRLAFAEAGTAVGSAGRAELSAAAEELTVDGTVATIRPAIRAGHKTLIAALAPDGTPLAVSLPPGERHDRDRRCRHPAHRSPPGSCRRCHGGPGHPRPRPRDAHRLPRLRGGRHRPYLRPPGLPHCRYHPSDRQPTRTVVGSGQSPLQAQARWLLGQRAAAPAATLDALPS